MKYTLSEKEYNDLDDLANRYIAIEHYLRNNATDDLGYPIFTGRKDVKFVNAKIDLHELYSLIGFFIDKNMEIKFIQ